MDFKHYNLYSKEKIGFWKKNIDFKASFHNNDS